MKCGTAIAALLIGSLWGCGASPRGAAATLSGQDAEDAMTSMRADPRPPTRPIVILNGFRSPALAARSLERDIVEGTGADPDRVALIAYPFIGDIDRCARDAVLDLQGRWPGTSEETVEVDVVGISMGGLVARWAALTPAERRELLAQRREPPGAEYPRLRITRLFTFATPHRGSDVARLGFSRAARDMSPGSPFLADLDRAPRDYPVVSYAHARDLMVDLRSSAPQGQEPIWSDGTVVFSHVTTHLDARFIADLLRRLRDECPLLEAQSLPAQD